MPVILSGLSRPSGERRISNRPHESFRLAQHDNLLMKLATASITELHNVKRCYTERVT